MDAFTRFHEELSATFEGPQTVEQRCSDLAAVLGSLEEVVEEPRCRQRENDDREEETTSLRVEAAVAAATAAAATGMLLCFEEAREKRRSHEGDLQKQDVRLEALTTRDRDFEVEAFHEREAALMRCLREERDLRAEEVRSLLACVESEKLKYESCREELRRALASNREGHSEKASYGKDLERWRRALERAEDDLEDCKKELQRRNRALCGARASAEANRRAAEDARQEAADIEDRMRKKLALAAEERLRALPPQRLREKNNKQVTRREEKEKTLQQEAQRLAYELSASRAEVEVQRQEATHLRDQLRTVVEERTRQRRRLKAEPAEDLSQRLDRAEAEAAASQALALLVTQKTKRLKRRLASLASDANRDVAAYGRAIIDHFHKLGLTPPLPPPDIPFCETRRRIYDDHQHHHHPGRRRRQTRRRQNDGGGTDDDHTTDDER